jgi:hypothetical protein
MDVGGGEGGWTLGAGEGHPDRRLGASKNACAPRAARRVRGIAQPGLTTDSNISALTG